MREDLWRVGEGGVGGLVNRWGGHCGGLERWGACFGRAV